MVLTGALDILLLLKRMNYNKTYADPVFKTPNALHIVW